MVNFLRSVGIFSTCFIPLCLVSSVTAAEDDLEEIVVTGYGIGDLQLDSANNAGSRLGLSLFETPASVSILTQEEIAAKGDYSALDAITRSAGLSSNANPGNGGSSISSRGFNGHNATMVTYDGIRLYVTAGTVTFPADTWTLDRVEVLRGAGSVINGIGAMGVTVNYIPKSPVFGESSFDALLGVGTLGMNRIALGGGAQLSDTTAFRLDATQYKKDGNVDRAEEERRVFAGSLLFKPSDDFHMKFSVDYANVDSPSYFGTPLINGKASKEHRKNNYNFADSLVEFEDFWARVHTQWNVTPNVTFRNDTYYLNVEREWQNLEEYGYNSVSNEIDRAYYLGIIHDQQQIGTRFDVLIESDFAGMSNKLTVGADFNSIDLDYLDNFSTGGFGVSDSVPIFGFNPGALPITTIPTILDYTTETTQFGFFFDDVIQITDKFSLVIGGRYDDLDYDRFDYAIGTSPSSKIDAGFSKFTWRTGLVYQASDTLSFYAQASTAADPVTSPTTISGSRKDFDLSEGKMFEVGVKQQMFDGKAEYTLAYFDIEKEGLLTRPPGSGITEQIGQQGSNGLEFTFRVIPIDRLSIDLNAAFINAEFDEFYSGGVSLAGNTPRNVPETTANIWVNWLPHDQLQLGVGMRYVDNRFGNNTNTDQLPAYTVFDASANWSVTKRITVMARAKNFTNEKDYVYSQYISDQWVFADPRSFELSLKYSL